MAEQPAPSTTSDERMLAGLAHIFGPVVALIVYATQKDKSRFVRFQAAQALAYDVLAIIVFVVLMGCVMGGMFAGPMVGFFGAAATTGPNGEIGVIPGILTSLAFILPFGGVCLVFLVAMIVLAGRVLAAINVFQGRDYRHPWLGARVESMLH